MPKHYFKLLAIFFIFLNVSMAQNRTITGQVASSNNEAIPGASVKVKNSTTGTSTNAEGKFSLSVPNGAITLVVSTIGYEGMEMAVPAGQTVVNFQLKESASLLDEVVVTALGISREKKPGVCYTNGQANRAY
ncbi:MAG: carboxypeptidase-like regulatory domain-containing protein [Spirosomataceae bacterium]